MVVTKNECDAIAREVNGWDKIDDEVYYNYDLFAKKVSNLSDTQFKVIYMRACKGYNWKTIATTLGVNVNSVKATYGRVHCMLGNNRANLWLYSPSDIILTNDSNIGLVKMDTRVWRALLRHGFKTIGDLKSASMDDLKSVRGLGDKSLIKLNEAFSARGISLPAFEDKSYEDDYVTVQVRVPKRSVKKNSVVSFVYDGKETAKAFKINDVSVQ